MWTHNVAFLSPHSNTVDKCVDWFLSYDNSRSWWPFFLLRKGTEQHYLIRSVYDYYIDIYRLRVFLTIHCEMQFGGLCVCGSLTWCFNLYISI